MNYQMHFDPYTGEHLKQRNDELLQEMEALRLEKQLRQNRQARSDARLVSFASRSTLPLIRRMGLA